MSEADKMFEELGYEFTNIDLDKFTHFHRYRKITEYENEYKKTQIIEFDLILKQIYAHNPISINELEIINEKVKELGWCKL